MEPESTTEVTPAPNAAPAPLYDNVSQAPSPDAPARDLPPASRPVFKVLREACLNIPGVRENVRHEGAVWKWIWAYEVGSFTICALHPLKDGVDLSFPLPTRYEPHFEKADLDKAVQEAVTKGETAARVRYVRLRIPDAESAPRLFGGVELKLRLMAEEKG